MLTIISTHAFTRTEVRRHIRIGAKRQSALAKMWMTTEKRRTLAAGSHVSKVEIKKSKFIGFAKHVENWNEAQKYINSVKEDHPKARHHCYGCRLGSNPFNDRSSDDGEPSGTAGAPILNAISGEGLSDTVVVIVRYFGGIKLGAGGLIRAYGAAARNVLREAPVDIIIPKSTLRIMVTSVHVGSVYEILRKFDGSASEEEYGIDGTLSVTLTFDLDAFDEVIESLKDVTRGDVVFLLKDK